MKKVFTIAFGLFFTTVIYSQDTEINPADSSNAKKSVAEKITISGFMDTYYSYNFNNPGANGNWGTNGVGRIFDGQHNQIAFNMIQTKITYESDRLEVVGDLLFGPGAELANFGNTGTALSIKQAYIAYDISDKFKFTVGQFGTHIGYELVDAPDNFNYSLSYLFGNGPFYHTGVKLDYALSDKIGLMAGVLNGWDNMLDNNLEQSYAAQVSITPNDKIGVYLNWIGGNEDPSSMTGDSLKSFKQMGDLTASFAITEKFNVGINAAAGLYDFDTLETKTWGGAALYLNYSFTDHFALGIRAEIFDDVDGAQYVGAAYSGYTLTAVISTANGHFLIKPEIRYDSSNEDIYYNDKDIVFNSNTGMFTTNTQNTQITGGVAFIAKF